MKPFQSYNKRKWNSFIMKGRVFFINFLTSFKKKMITHRSNEDITYGAQANVSYMSEFDPPPLFVNSMEFVRLMGWGIISLILNPVNFQKVVGGLIRRRPEVSGLQFMSASLHKLSAH